MLSERFSTCDMRTCILGFECESRRFKSQLKFILGPNNEFHLNNCPWCYDTEEGPDTCSCYRALNNPKKFLRKHLKDKRSTRLVEIPNPVDHEQQEFDPEENINDFYRYRVCDRENVFKWYEIYKATRNALGFQLKVRHFKIEEEIDAVYFSGEWHLTDCIRSVSLDDTCDTCPCYLAMQNPWKYLTQTYGYYDIKKMVKRIREKKTPDKYIMSDGEIYFETIN